MHTDGLRAMVGCDFLNSFRVAGDGGTGFEGNLTCARFHARLVYDYPPCHSGARKAVCSHG